MNDIKQRGVEDVLFACVDSLKGFPEAIESAFPRTQVQLCIVHHEDSPIKFVLFAFSLTISPQ
jgi:putative transposase